MNVLALFLCLTNRVYRSRPKLVSKVPQLVPLVRCVSNVVASVLFTELTLTRSALLLCISASVRRLTKRLRKFIGTPGAENSASSLPVLTSRLKVLTLILVLFGTQGKLPRIRLIMRTALLVLWCPVTTGNRLRATLGP